MKHLKDAKQLLDDGNTQGAYEITEHILALSPRNSEALRIKAFILDCWGRFDESFTILRQLSKLYGNDPDVAEDLERRLEEDRESIIYSKLTPQGRWYFPFSAMQIFACLSGLTGGVLFLVSTPAYLNQPDGRLFLSISFVFLVLLPWVFLIVLNFYGLKKVLVGFRGIQVFYGIKKVTYTWEELGHAVIEYDTNLYANYLQLTIYSRATREPLLVFDISKRNSVVKARRHFVRLILSYIENVSYVPRGKPLEPEGAVNHNYERVS